MSSHSTRKPRSRKAAAAERPKKPYPEFPLSPHPSGAWQKKIRGKIHYFGRWGRMVDGVMVRIEGDGWEEALALYKVQADDLHAGRTPRVQSGELTIAGLCNAFLTAKQQQYEAGEISARMYKPGPTPAQATGEYKSTTDRLISAFGKTRLVDDLAADDFGTLRASLAKQFGPVRLGNEVQKVRTVFKFGSDNGLITKTIRFGSQFKKPGKRVLRRHRAENGKRTFEVSELRALIDVAGMPLKAMILLGINAGFGNADCGLLPLSAVDLDGGWVTFPRPKTGIQRRCPLWPETVEALRAAIVDRPEPKHESAANLVFVTKYGRPWSTEGTSGAVTHETIKLLQKIGVCRKGLAFYGLRHTFRTIADASRDPNAIRHIMGHTDDSIDDNYTHGIEDGRLVAVAEHVRKWLFGKTTDAEPEDTGAETAEPSVLCDGETEDASAEGTQGQPESDDLASVDARPTLRLYVG